MPSFLKSLTPPIPRTFSCTIRVAAVKMARDQAIDFVILNNICIQQVERYASDTGKPRLCVHFAAPDVNHNKNPLLVRVRDLRYSKLRLEYVGVSFFLPAVVSDLLAEISITV
jgi:hypothetical protein